MTEIPEQLAQAVGDRYTFARELARGGMATVYLAHDSQGSRQVAIKVMHQRLASAIGPERFLREIALVQSMSHPLIVPYYDSGGAGELLYYIMPYVAGETVFDRLERERRIPLDDALQITRDVASALGYAHSRGVLHRDVKPENILLAGGRALVADFGLARAIGSAEYEKLTQTGVIVGTIYYMSPEQLREDTLDHRTDVYSLGCILFEMLTGGPPYAGRTLKEVATRILQAPVPSVRQIEPSVPVGIDQAIGRSLAKAAADRFATMEEFATALGDAGR